MDNLEPDVSEIDHHPLLPNFDRSYVPLRERFRRLWAMMDRINTSDQRRSDCISYFDYLAYFRMAAPPFSVAVHRAVAPSDGYLPSCFDCHQMLSGLSGFSQGDMLSVPAMDQDETVSWLTSDAITGHFIVHRLD
jgi:hypothetical protein